MRPIDTLRRARQKRELAIRLRGLADDLSDEASIKLLISHACNLESEAELLDLDNAAGWPDGGTATE
jgi:hypothetical protein